MKILDYFKEETGVDLHVKPVITKNKIRMFCNKHNIDEDNLLHILRTNQQIKQKLIDYLTTNETYFYREYHQIETLVDKAKEMQGRIDILSLPCSTGEEPYSIAIALLENDIQNFRIVGVDINQEVIQHAKRGIYRKQKFRNMPEYVINKYFIKQDDKYILNSYIKSLVEFKVMNLFENSIYTLGKFDFIFCRNLFIYFDKPTKQKAKEILQKLKKSENSIIFYGHADLF
ncbi:MAG: protein-glutamate O-methyltransferase CheR [Epsilonproteobacteria bacterium]|nr:protein-glutamate O-methyltransferase CheR [Campylobacterota bacterium]